MAAAIVFAAGAAIASRQPPDVAARERGYRANNVGVALLEQFDYESAARSFNEALKIHPGLDIARLNLAIALFYGGKTAEAAAEASEATKRLPTLPQSHYVAGLAYRAEDNLDAARSAFEGVLKVDRADAGANVNLGQIALQQRQYDRALEYFRQAMAAEPYNVTAAYSAALALTRSGKQDEGRKAMQHFEALRDSAYGVTYAQTYLAQGKYAEAIASTGAEPELVNPATPAVTFSDATVNFGLPAAARGGDSGSVALSDVDADGDLDVLEAGRTGVRFLRNENGTFRDATGAAGLPKTGATRGLLIGDYDNDTRPDLFLVRTDGYVLLHQGSSNTFDDVSQKAGIAVARPPAAADAGLQPAAFADVDHDGDLDVVIAGPPMRLLRNNGDGTFADIAKQSGLGASQSTVAVGATDYDNRRDIDLVVLPRDGAPILYRNMRDGSFRDAASDSGFPAAGSYSALAIGDVNKDGFTDFFWGRPAQAGILSSSDGQTKFRNTPAHDATAGANAAQFVDYDNDGLLDLFTLSDTRARLFRNVGAGKWADVTDAARLPSAGTDKQARFESLALGDLDNDGDVDAIVRLSTGDLRIWRNDGGNRNASLRVRLASRVSNRSGVGARVEIRAGSLRQQAESSSSTPAVAPADILFGLGSRASADVLRVLWPSGILQAETNLQPEGRTVTITELDRKPSSCPYLFTWNGNRFEFVTDFMGGGEMGAWLAPGVWNHPDPDEYVRLSRDQLRARRGFYELRVTNELEEALFVDRMQLIAADHPADVEVFPNEGLRSPPRPPFALTAIRDARPPVRAVDERGHDVLAELASIDRRYPDDFRLQSVRGYAESHFVELDLGDRSDPQVLLLTGWTDYAFSNDNVAASQLRTAMAPPSLQVKDRAGQWQP